MARETEPFGLVCFSVLFFGLTLVDGLLSADVCWCFVVGSLLRRI